MKTWQILWRLLRYSPGSYCLSILLQIPRRLIFLVPALIVQQIFDILSQEGHLSESFWKLIALFVGVGVARLALLVISIYTELFSQYNSTTLLRKNLLMQIFAQPGANRLPYAPGDMLNRLQEDPTTIAFAMTMFIFAGGVGVETLVAVVIMAKINLLITLVAVLPLLLGGIIVNLASKPIQYFRRTKRQTTGQVSAYLGEVLGAAQAIQLATAENSVIEQLTQHNAVRRRAALRESFFDKVLLGFFDTGTANIGTALVVLLAGQALQAGSFTVGDFALFTTYLTSLNSFIGLISNEITRYKQIAVAHERLSPLLFDASPEELVRYGPVRPNHPHLDTSSIQKTPSDRLHVLEVNDLSYHHPDSNRGIEGVNLRIQQGQLVVIVGRVGAGKTTLLRTLLGLFPKESGIIRWNNEIVSDSSTFFVPPRSAYTPQIPTLFSLSLEENIRLGLAANDDDLQRALHQAVLEYDLTQLQEGVHTLVGPQGTRLSGGQVLRATAARMFLRRAELLVIDDLSSALDIHTEQTLWNRLFGEDSHSSAERGSLNRERNQTYLVVSHRQSLLRLADHIIVLKAGKVEAEGTLSQLSASCEEMRYLWAGTQTDEEQVTSLEESGLP